MSFSAPIGQQFERDSGIIWPGRWVDATGYLTHYSLGYHTGADLNLNYPTFDYDRHSDVFAIGDGSVIYAQRYPNPNAWGNIIIIDHGVIEGKPLFSRYGHVEAINVADGQQVQKGQQIAKVGNGEGLFPYHLHFDISLSEVLRTTPGHWPGNNQALVQQHYTDPKIWLRQHVDGVVIPATQVWFVIAKIGLRVRSRHNTSAKQVGSLRYGTSVRLEDAQRVDEDTYTWGRIWGGVYNGNWVAMGKTNQSMTFLSTTPPGN